MTGEKKKKERVVILVLADKHGFLNHAYKYEHILMFNYKEHTIHTPKM